MSSITYFACPTCGAPLRPTIQTTGSDRCLYCDTISIYKDDHVENENGTPSTFDKSVGTFRRYGTVLAAPLLGWSACTLFNIDRHHITYENLDGLLVAFSIFILMILHRWVMASIWLLFCCLAFLLERAQAVHRPGPLAYFSMTSESTLMPICICAFLIFWFVTFLVLKSDNRLEHEQQKIAWRTPVALSFALGLLGGVYYYSQPMTLEIYKNWSWLYAHEMQRLTDLSWEINQYKPAPIPKDISPAPLWVKGAPEASNTVFFPREYMELFPKNNFFTKKGEDHLWLTGHYVTYLQDLPESAGNGYFSPPIAQEGWKEKITSPLLADWLVVYESKDAENLICFWLVQRKELSNDGFTMPEYDFEIVGFHQFEWKESLLDIDTQEKAKMKLLEVLGAQTGGRFQAQ